MTRGEIIIIIIIIKIVTRRIGNETEAYPVSEFIQIYTYVLYVQTTKYNIIM